MLTLLVVKRKNLTAEEVEDDVVQAVVKLEDNIVRDEFVAVGAADSNGRQALVSETV